MASKMLSSDSCLHEFYYNFILCQACSGAGVTVSAEQGKLSPPGPEITPGNERQTGAREAWEEAFAG